jgi:hypothetical protein
VSGKRIFKNSEMGDFTELRVWVKAKDLAVFII